MAIIDPRRLRKAARAIANLTQLLDEDDPHNVVPFGELPQRDKEASELIAKNLINLVDALNGRD